MLVDETVVIETDHPYKLAEMAGKVHIPGARQLEVRFAKRSCTEGRHSMTLSTTKNGDALHRCEVAAGLLSHRSLRCRSYLHWR